MGDSEILLSEEENRYVLFPIRHDTIWKKYKQAEANFWTTEELDLSKDMNDYNNLTNNEQYFLNNKFYDFKYYFVNQKS